MNNKQVYKITYTDSFDWHVYVVASSEREAANFAQDQIFDLEYDEEEMYRSGPAQDQIFDLEYDEEEMSRSGPFIEPVDRDDGDYEICEEYIDYCEDQDRNGLLCLPHLKWLAEQD